MGKYILLIAVAVSTFGCSTTPPLPPEPKGPLVKVNINQPHAVYRGIEQ